MLIRASVLALLLSLAATAGETQPVNGVFVAAGHQTLTVAGTSVGLTVPATANAVTLQVLAQPVRYTVDGTVPVGATTGFLAVAGDYVTVYGRPNVLALRLIRDTGSSATVQAEFLRVQF